MQSVEQTAMPFRGCLRVCRGQAVLREQASGFADLANEVPNTQETRFATASCGQVLEAAIPHLAAGGGLSGRSRIRC